MYSRYVVVLLCPRDKTDGAGIALPDGTFLIANGAHQGVAGFGLATDPNYSAVLYDPTQPIGERFSILNNTIVARLYHSEATVRHLPDIHEFVAHRSFH